MALKRPNSFDAIAMQTTTVKQFWGRPHFYPTSPSPAVSRYIARGVRPQFVQAREGLHVHSTGKETVVVVPPRRMSCVPTKNESLAKANYLSVAVSVGLTKDGGANQTPAWSCRDNLKRCCLLSCLPDNFEPNTSYIP